MRIFCWLWLCLFLITGLQTFAQEVPPRPTPPRLVNDLAGVLLRQEADDLERKLVAYNDSTSTQIAIVTVRTTGDYDISETALKILRDWGVGSKEKNNGLVILAAIEDRKVRIETGYGLEGAVPDAIANRIIDQIIVPNFREGHYYQGLDQAVNAIEKAAAGEYKAIPKKRRGKGGGSIFVLVVVAIILLSMINNRRGGGTTISRRGWGGWGIPMGGGWSSGSGGGWGGGGGGGFGGFGGGSGGGGGASGSW
jgi:uncharacterized protein